MAKKNKTLGLVIIGLLAAGGVYAYMKMRNKPMQLDMGKPASSDSGGDSGQGAYTPMIVATNTSNLNIRSKPSISSSIVGKIGKGYSVYARPSSVSGWSEVSKDGSSSEGYVSSQYLK